jgi:hypothetical protein
MESICDAPFPASLAKTKSNIFRLARASKSLKRKKDAGSKQADLQSGIQTHLCNLFPNIRRERTTQCNLHAEVKSIIMRNSPEFSEG